MKKYCPRCGQRYDNGQQRICLNDGAMLSLPDSYRLVGSTLDSKYRIDALVGIGGFGAVYSAYHLGLDRQVAFKILQPNVALQAPEAINLFEEEAKTAARLLHENIVTIHDAGRTMDGLSYIAMEWLEGRPLDEELKACGRLSFERTAEILWQVAAALTFAHIHRTVHRDLKPGNVMLIQRPDGAEQVKVVDFGIAKVLSSTVGSMVSRSIGTPAYASPEQWKQGAQIDGRADIYALGVMLYQMLTGHLPFNAPSVEELIRLKLNTAPPPLGRLLPNAPAAVEELLQRMMKIDPNQRPQKVSEVPALFEMACKTLLGVDVELLRATTVADKTVQGSSIDIVPLNVKATQPRVSTPQPQVNRPTHKRANRRWLVMLAGLLFFVALFIAIIVLSVFRSPLKQEVLQLRDPEVNAAFARHLEGRSDEARSLVNDVLTANPNNAEAHFALGRIDLDRMMYEDAVSHLGQAARLNATLPDIWVHLARTYLGLGQARNAMDALQRGMTGAYRPRDPEVNAAFARHLEGYSDEARVRINAVLTATTKTVNAEAHFFLGRIDFDQRRVEDAVNHLSKAAREDASLPDVWAHLAMAYLGLGQTRNAMGALDHIIKPSSYRQQAQARDAQQQAQMKLKLENQNQKEGQIGRLREKIAEINKRLAVSDNPALKGKRKVWIESLNILSQRLDEISKMSSDQLQEISHACDEVGKELKKIEDEANSLVG